MITEAVEQGEIAVDMAPDNIEARMLLGGLYSGLKMFEPARAQFEEILKSMPGHAEAADLLGRFACRAKASTTSRSSISKRWRKTRTSKSPRRLTITSVVCAPSRAPSITPRRKRRFAKALDLKPEYPEAATALAMLLRAQEQRQADGNAAAHPIRRNSVLNMKWPAS